MGQAKRRTWPARTRLFRLVISGEMTGVVAIAGVAIVDQLLVGLLGFRREHDALHRRRLLAAAWGAFVGLRRLSHAAVPLKLCDGIAERPRLLQRQNGAAGIGRDQSPKRFQRSRSSMAEMMPPKMPAAGSPVMPRRRRSQPLLPVGMRKTRTFSPYFSRSTSRRSPTRSARPR